jgi:hypothetical protein
VELWFGGATSRLLIPPVSVSLSIMMDDDDDEKEGAFLMTFLPLLISSFCDL